MADGHALAVEAGRLAFKAGRIGKKLYATASSPIEGVPEWTELSASRSAWSPTGARGRGRPLRRCVEECLAAGLRAVQLREKDLAVRDLLRSGGGAASRRRRRSRARLIVNDRARRRARRGRGRRAAHARRRSPSRVLRGAGGAPVSRSAPLCTRRRRRSRPRREGADFSSSAPSTTRRPSARTARPRGCDALARGGTTRYAARCSRSAGITPARAPEVLAAGAEGVAVIGAILGPRRPADATEGVPRRLGTA